MTDPIRRLSLATVLAIALPVWADDATPPADAPKDAPKPPASSSVLNPNTGPQMHAAGTITGKLSKSSDGSVTLKLPELERKTSGRRAPTQEVAKDHSYDLADDVKIRWHNLPKKPDGKTYTDQEYQALREPVGALGYKADKSDLKPGQTVRLYLSKAAGKDEKPVVTTVMIVADAPKHDDTSKKKN